MSEILEDALRRLVVMGSGVQCIPGNDPGERPTGAYASLLESDDDSRGYAADVEDGGVRASSLQKRAVYSLQFYRGGERDPSEAARSFVAWAHSVTGREAVEVTSAMIGVPFRIVQPFGHRRLDIPVGDKWEHRAVIDLRVDYADDRAEAVPTIAGRSGTITLSTPGGDIEETIQDG